MLCRGLPTLLSTVGLTMLALGFGYVPPVTVRLSPPELRLRHVLTFGAVAVAIAGHALRHH